MGPKDGIAGMGNDDGREKGSEKGTPEPSFKDVGVEPNNSMTPLPDAGKAE